MAAVTQIGSARSSPSPFDDEQSLMGNANWQSMPPPPQSAAGSTASSMPAESTVPLQKRRRVTRACDGCRRKKIKCDGEQPCSHCVNYKTECVFTLVEKKRNPPKGAKYIEGLENRLGRMESLLKLSGLLPDGDETTDLGDLERRLQESARSGSNPARSSSESIRGVSRASTATNSPRNSKEEEEVDFLSDQMCSLVTNNYGETRFIGSSSGFSIFSPKGIQWVNEKTGDKSFQQMITDVTSEKSGYPRLSFTWHPEVFGGLFDNRGKHSLPPRNIASALVQDFFTNFNTLFPLFHKDSFEHMFEKQYSDDPPNESGWYAAYNMVLAIAYRLQLSHTSSVNDTATAKSHGSKAWQYFQNAASVLTELLLKNTDLMSIRAILAMALFMQGTANPQPSFFLIAAAVRIATSIGMHRRGSSFGLSPHEAEQRSRIYWMLYILDKDMALRSGRPPCINDDDCNVELPEEDPLDGIGNIPLHKSKGKFNIFRSMASFSVIGSKVYMQLYSAKAGRQSDGEILNTIGELDRELEQWKESIPLEYRPDSDLSSMDQSGPLILCIVLLHCAYYNCLTTVHRMSIHHGYWSSRLSNYAIAGLSARPLNPRIFSSAALCVSAARSSIHLLKFLNEKDYPCIWLVMYYPVASLFTLFANTLQNPQDPRARSDLRLMSNVVEFIKTVLDGDDFGGDTPYKHVYEDGSITRMLQVCSEFQRIAKLVLDKADKESLNKRKRKPEERSQRPLTVSGVTTSPNQTSTMVDTTPPPYAPPTDINSQYFGGDFGMPSSPGMSWLNDLGSPSTIPPPVTSNSDISFTPLGNAYEAPFIPNDLWQLGQLGQTFEWDWTDVNSHTAWDSNPPSNGDI